MQVGSIVGCLTSREKVATGTVVERGAMVAQGAGYNLQTLLLLKGSIERRGVRRARTWAAARTGQKLMQVS